MITYSSRTFFVYEADYDSNLAPLASVSFTFNTHGDSDFFWQKFAMFALVSGAATGKGADQLPAVYLTVTNQTTGRQYFSGPAPANGQVATPNVSGYQQFLPMMCVWPRKSSILVEMENFDIGPGGTTYSRLQLSFMGTKAFPGREATNV